MRQHAAGETASEDLVAQQVGELSGAVRAEPAAARGRYRTGVLAGAFGGHVPDHTDGIRPMVLPQYCATAHPPGHRCDLLFPLPDGKICHRSAVPGARSTPAVPPGAR
ncbi:hypothetical protein T261_0423 [Streptomyces lydicus]|nr:hypothetical protein T261_0423 [Streptomyces lydicus]